MSYLKVILFILNVFLINKLNIANITLVLINASMVAVGWLLEGLINQERWLPLN